jgi:hypothetical protein
MADRPVPDSIAAAPPLVPSILDHWSGNREDSTGAVEIHTFEAIEEKELRSPCLSSAFTAEVSTVIVGARALPLLVSLSAMAVKTNPSNYS